MPTALNIVMCTVNTNMNKIVSVPEGFNEWLFNWDDYFDKLSYTET